MSISSSSLQAQVAIGRPRGLVEHGASGYGYR